MKRTVLFLCAFCSALNGFTQTCVFDSTILITGAIVSPEPWSPSAPFINTNPACVNDPYLQSITFNVPDSIQAPGVPIPFAITNIAIPTSGALTGLPAGLTYLCTPPNCVFPKNTLGCLLIYGTPNNTNIAPDTTELSVTVNVTSSSFPFPIPIQFPGTIAPDSKFFIILKEQGQCISSTTDLGRQIAQIKSAPNPFSNQTIITVTALVNDQFQFELFNITGQRVLADQMQLFQGENQYTLDAGNLPNGAYYFVIGNGTGRAAHRVIISR